MILSKARSRSTRLGWKTAPQTKAETNTNAAFLRLLSSSSSPSLLFQDRTIHTASTNYNHNSIIVCASRLTAKATQTQSRMLASTALGHGSSNHIKNPESNHSHSKHHLGEDWSLDELVSVDNLLEQDDPENDKKVAKILVDFIKRLELNSGRLTDLQQNVEDFHSRLRNLQSRRRSTTKRRGKTREKNAAAAIQETMHMLEGERKTLRNLQRLHYDTWKSARDQYLQWGRTYGDIDKDKDKDDDDDDEYDDSMVLLLTNPKKRIARWNGVVGAATEIQARHAMTIEQMSELVIRLNALRSGANTALPVGGSGGDEEEESFNHDLDEMYETVCAFLRCRMTQQLLCQHLISSGKDALGTSVAKKIEAKRKADLEAGRIATTNTNSAALKTASRSRVVGAINVDSPVASIVRSSVTEASQLCEATYLVSPPMAFVLATEICSGELQHQHIHIYDETIDNQGYESVSATFVRSWLQYTLIELLKNAMAATVESNPEIAKAALEDDLGSSDSDSDSGSDDEAREPQQQLPSLYVHVFDDDDRSESVVIKIYDQGGGIREDFDLESLFRFAQRDTVWDRMDEQQTYSRK
jgi:hypothetical protein